MAGPDQEWIDASDRIVLESQDGGLEVFVVLPDDITLLTARVLLGDRKAAMLIDAGDLLIKQTKNTPRRKRSVCLCCPKRIWGGYAAMVFAIPVTAAPTTSVGMFICEFCGAGQSREALESKAKAGIFASWPGIQELPEPTHPHGGRA